MPHVTHNKKLVRLGEEIVDLVSYFVATDEVFSD
jgi:hypothetical protein